MINNIIDIGKNKRYNGNPNIGVLNHPPKNG